MKRIAQASFGIAILATTALTLRSPPIWNRIAYEPCTVYEQVSPAVVGFDASIRYGAYPNDALRKRHALFLGEEYLPPARCVPCSRAKHELCAGTRSYFRTQQPFPDLSLSDPVQYRCQCSCSN